ncbi:Erythropoietin [Heterocephalus glaber]|uniref:Erythropoietin n=1 Tax=Heterocephalus glaber TaxID=10181 RepID=G5AV46_HETGA|nr:Erythropoietin [Heterocephalus glaber]
MTSTKLSPYDGGHGSGHSRRVHWKEVGDRIRGLACEGTGSSSRFLLEVGVTRTIEVGVTRTRLFSGKPPEQHSHPVPQAPASRAGGQALSGPSGGRSGGTSPRPGSPLPLLWLCPPQPSALAPSPWSGQDSDAGVRGPGEQSLEGRGAGTAHTQMRVDVCACARPAAALGSEGRPEQAQESPTWLLLSLLLLPLGLQAPLDGPPRLICDSRVLERYILEAKDAENVTMSCMESCSLGENITVPDTKVNFYAWKRMEVGQRAAEVWQGLALLSEAILRGQALLANSSQPSETLRLHVDKAVSGLRSLTSLLRMLGAQKEPILPPDAASPAPLRTFTVDSLCKLFRVYSNFLRGKLKLYTGEACRRGDR